MSLSIELEVKVQINILDPANLGIGGIKHNLNGGGVSGDILKRNIFGDGVLIREIVGGCVGGQRLGQTQFDIEVLSFANRDRRG